MSDTRFSPLGSASVPALQPSLIQQDGSVASTSSSITASNVPPPVDSYTVAPADATHGGGKRTYISDDMLPILRGDSSVGPTKMNALLAPVPPHPTKADIATAGKRYRKRLLRERNLQGAFPTFIHRSSIPPTPAHPSVQFGGCSLSPTPGFFPVSSIAPFALDTLVTDVRQAFPSSSVEASAACADSNASIHCDDTADSFFMHPSEYQLSSHSELSAFASDGGSVPLLQHQGSIVSREGPCFSTHY